MENSSASVGQKCKYKGLTNFTLQIHAGSDLKINICNCYKITLETKTEIKSFLPLNCTACYYKNTYCVYMSYKVLFCCKINLTYNVTILFSKQCYFLVDMAAIAGPIPLLIVIEFLYKTHKINHLKHRIGFLKTAWWMSANQTKGF